MKKNSNRKPDAVARDFAALVKAWRDRRQLSQPKAAARLGVPYRTFQDWEYGVATPRGLAYDLIVRRLQH